MVSLNYKRFQRSTHDLRALNDMSSQEELLWARLHLTMERPKYNIATYTKIPNLCPKPSALDIVNA